MHSTSLATDQTQTTRSLADAKIRREIDDSVSTRSLQGLLSKLSILRENRETSIMQMQQQLDSIYEQMQKTKREVSVIEAKEKAIRTAIRQLEDAGL